MKRSACSSGRSIVLATSASFLAGACGAPAGGDGPDGEFPGTEPATRPAWAVAAEPFLTIGGSESDPSDQHHDVGGALWLGEEGAVVVAVGAGVVAAGLEVSRYDAAGVYRGATGQRGDGPGDFRTVTWMGRYAGDTVAIYDRVNRRISVLDAQGSFARSFRLATPTLEPAATLTPAYIAGVLDDGSVVVRWLRSLSGPLVPGSQVFHSGERLVMHDPEGNPSRHLADARGRETHRPASPGGLWRAPFAPVPRHLARGGRVYIAEGLEYAVQILDRSGDTAAVATDGRPPLPVTEAARVAFLEDSLPGLRPDSREAIGEVLRTLMVHDTIPGLQDLHVDDGMHVWMRAREELGPATEWDVFSPEGEHVARLARPANRRVLDIADDCILLTSGPFGEDRVQAFALRRGEG